MSGRGFLTLKDMRPSSPIGEYVSGSALCTQSGSSNYFKISVTGLSFQPKIVLVSTDPFSGHSAHFSNITAMLFPTGNYLTGTMRNSYPYVLVSGSLQNGITSTTSQGAGDSQFQLTPNGFTMIVAESNTITSATVNWLALRGQ